MSFVIRDSPEVAAAKENRMKGSSSYHFGKTVKSRSGNSEDDHDPRVQKRNTFVITDTDGDDYHNSASNFLLDPTFKGMDLDLKSQEDHVSRLAELSSAAKSSGIIFDSGGDEQLVVVAGFTDKLIDHMMQKKLDDNYITSFVLTHTYHTTGEYLLSRLTSLYSETDDEDVEAAVEYIIKRWIELVFPQFKSDKKLMGDLISFIGKTLPSNGKLEVAKQFQREIQAITQKPVVKYDSSVPGVPKIKSPKSRSGKDGKEEMLSFLDIPVSELARQLTLIDFKSYCECPITEYMKQAWNAKNCAEIAPNLVKKINSFNETSYWAAAEIVFNGEIKKRIKTIKRLVKLAEKCLEINNFSTAMAVVAGLHLSSVSRLKKTWKHVPTKTTESFQEITKLLAEGNYKYYRSKLEKAVGPTNPYIGLFLKDLTFIEVGNPEELDTLVNFDRLRMASSVFKDVLRYQKLPFMFEEVPSIQNYFNTATKLNDDSLRKYSEKAEPPEPKTKTT